MRIELIKSVERNYILDMIYMSKGGAISKRRIKVMQVGEVSFRAYCYLRKSNRTFKIDNILALVPVTSRERMVV
ncbi:transcriptional regulator [Sporosarcina sp. P2]|uniref:transcriptional regulator n=1 Tax=Sporosarcina sp. P2 TaxID=2048251 RepID=UPI000C17157E|nr:transcriptional regulator [Sporosarcina sp. P2]PID03756.1 transcriptional regulator [Sporosarcina sp. P2]